jgi:hypothetical protein
LPFTRREALMSTGALAAASAFPLATTVTMAQGASPSSPPIPPSGTEPICLADFEPLAKAKMPTLGWEYINGGAGDELTTQWNKEAYQRIRLKPHVLVNVSRLDTRVTLFGQEHAFPILLAPTAAQKIDPSGGGIGHGLGAQGES